VVTWNLGGVFADAYALSGGELWVRAADGRLLRFDARTGARQASVQATPGPASRLVAIPGAGVVVGHDDGTLERVDGTTGRAVWRTRVEDKPGQLTIAGGVLWAFVQSRGSERLVAVDLDTGRTRSTLALGAADDYYALAPAGGALWVITPAGQGLVISP
jgi:outer membrane protein assembly factor BamB